jgi:UDP-hydrolysing UDP-N-acetyl-D-glucosamine 2-epimerase
MKKRRTIAVVTGTRAEFGLLTPIMRAIDAHPRLALKLIVTGTHLTAGTWRDIRAAGFTIDARVPMQRKGKSGRAADADALGRGVRGLGRAFAELRPDVALVLGDRIEAFAAASAASVGGFRVAHVHGGDRAEGVADEAMRHAITKLAHLHFPATARSRERIIRMGERPGFVWNIGSPAADGLDTIEPSVDAPEIVLLQHPIGESDKREAAWMRQTLAAVADFQALVIGPNHDPGGDGIRAVLDPDRHFVVDSLPRPAFLSLLAGARAIVGNSSAGLIEAAVLKVPCVNIGPRQAGREKPANVVDCDYGEQNVRKALKRALRLDLRRMRHPYGDGRAGERIANRLATIDLDAAPLRKRNAY